MHNTGNNSDETITKPFSRINNNARISSLVAVSGVFCGAGLRIAVHSKLVLDKIVLDAEVLLRVDEYGGMNVRSSVNVVAVERVYW
mmetsp:Transcript_34073/g.46804  ORF Transcript_34073/g.46804 Transcript_34073/m.46804 type:complete len:86 (+) Transcript_34073:287-544(+)